LSGKDVAAPVTNSARRVDGLAPLPIKRLSLRSKPQLRLCLRFRYGNHPFLFCEMMAPLQATKTRAAPA